MPEILSGGESLIARARQEIAAPGTTRIRWALGYLFVPGLGPLWDALEGASAATAEIHLLIGNTAGVLTDEQRIAAADEAAAEAQATGVTLEMDVAAAARAERDRIVAATARALRENLHRSVPRTPENARLLIGLARAVTDGRVRVRIYPDGRLHAKAYIFERGSSGPTVIVGSSNLTLPSPDNPTELNVLLREETGYGSVTAWFERLWGASQDFGRDLVTELSRSWPLMPGPDEETPTAAAAAASATRIPAAE